ncbi:maleylacetoacetate isomerase [Saprolegnia parasitica CBS 223.65]|uniref:Maleylacetoacetate isomerase n=1 Tax=Saprolegnia parasitica (strain CBS 223.65) TaxID=695850 RepID=A0A067C380_SAPPC|nr:maleylacetoacetate isomerase [Saprolegnia parasitica CBS 223.65]KDO21242.1 maleylacetoacetate isomerase [Saprolegnia parasitica CBS 223.65]|eukprot:XP_012208073.1 maleylacetoacetate isomerase [Saprolegnia parasitica CBS 223.65]
MATETKPTTKLHSYWRSSCSWRVRISLAYKQIPYEYVAVNLLKAEQVGPAFTAINPNGRVPTLEIDGHALHQSGAILEYLEETHPAHPLLPADALGRAHVRNLCGLIGCDIQPIQNLAVMKRAVINYAEADQMAARMAWSKEWIERGFHVLEAELAKTAGKYCVGDAISLADVYLEPQVYNANRFQVDMAKYPTIARIVAALAEHPAFYAAHPSQQPDATE